MAESSNVRRVKPYPFKGQLKDVRGAYPGQILKLTLQGLMIEVGGSSVQPGDKVEVSFTTPVLNGAVILAGVVVKIYNQLTGGSQAVTAGGAVGSVGGGSTIHLIEVHYKSVPPDSMSRIAHFLESTGQAKRG